MQLTLLKKDLLTKLQIISHVLTGRISVYENVTFLADDGLTLYATDGMVSIFANVGANIHEKGIVSVNGARLKEIVTTYPDKPIEIKATKDIVTLTCEGFQNILYQSLDNAIPQIPDIDYVRVDAVKQFSSLSWANYIAIMGQDIIGINDPNHKTQMGLVEGNLNCNTVVPLVFVRLVERLDVNTLCEFGFTNSVIILKQNDYTLLAGLEMPDPLAYQGILDSPINNYFDYNPEIINALTNAGKYNPEVIISFENGVVNIRANDAKTGGADITLNLSGKGSGTFKVFANQLISAINRTKTKIGLADNGIVTLPTDDYIEVVAPLKR